MRVSTRIVLVMVLVVGEMAGALLPYDTANAAVTSPGGDWTGRGPYTGYFSNEYYPKYNVCPYSARGANNCKGTNNGQNVVLPGDSACSANKKDALPVQCVAGSGSDTARVKSLINLLSSYNKSSDKLKHSSSGFIFQTLIGNDGAQANSNGGRSVGNAKVPNETQRGWAGLETLLDAELANGQIHISWNSYIKSNIRTYAMYIANQNNADVAYDPGDGPQDDPAIIIYNNKNTPIYILFRPCANPGGNLNGLPPLKQPSLHPSCGGVNVDPGAPDPKTVYVVQNATIRYNSSAEVATAKSEGGKFFIDITGPSVNYNNGDVPTTSSGSNLIAANVKPGASNNTGKYTLKYGISGTTKPITCTYNFQITDQPIVVTTSGGSGEGMSIGGVDCAVPTDKYGGLVSWNIGTSGGYAGAGTKYAAFALNHLQGFATAQDGAGGTSSDPTKLAFANTTPDAGINLSQQLFGGLYGGTSCTRDYFADHPSAQTPVHTITQTSGDIGKSIYMVGSVTVNGLNISSNTQTAIYVNGNVFINGPIRFTDANTGYANVAAIPSFDLIVQGNIYIAPNVTELDGLYVAEPTSATNAGVIYTCTQAPFTYQRLNASLYGNCHKYPLTVNGSFVARQVWFLRAGGSVTGSPAESVNFSPEVWLNTPPETVSGSGGTADTYDAITSLPPVL